MENPSTSPKASLLKKTQQSFGKQLKNFLTKYYPNWSVGKPFEELGEGFENETGITFRTLQHWYKGESFPIRFPNFLEKMKSASTKFSTRIKEQGFDKDLEALESAWENLFRSKNEISPNQNLLPTAISKLDSNYKDNFDRKRIIMATLVVIVFILLSVLFTVRQVLYPNGWNVVLKQPDDESIVIVNGNIITVRYNKKQNFDLPISLQPFLHQGDSPNYVNYLLLNGMGWADWSFKLRYGRNVREDVTGADKEALEYSTIVNRMFLLLPNGETEEIPLEIIPINQRLPGTWDVDIIAQDTAVILVNGRAVAAKNHRRDKGFGNIDISPYLKTNENNRVQILIWSNDPEFFEWEFHLLHDNEVIFPKEEESKGEGKGIIGEVKVLDFTITANGTVLWSS